MKSMRVIPFWGRLALLFAVLLPAAAQAWAQYGYQPKPRWNRLTYEVGAGFNAPQGKSSDYIRWGGNFTFGAGYQFSPRLAMMANYQFIGDGLPKRMIQETGATGGNAHLWSLTLNPQFSIFPNSTNDLYVTGGGGFYRKMTNFTDPALTRYCTYYYCGVGYTNVVIGHFSSNQGGWNVGMGYQRRLAGTARTRFFAEARYLHVMSPATRVAPNGLGVTAVAADTNLIPVTVGLRF